MMQTDQGQAGFMTECTICLFSRNLLINGLDVATRWYRAPEIMLSFANYVSYPISNEAPH